jgi:hypothetical protein
MRDYQPCTARDGEHESGGTKWKMEGEFGKWKDEMEIGRMALVGHRTHVI